MPFQKVGKVEYRYTVDPECPICTSEKNGKSYRAELDKFLVSHPVSEAIPLLLEVGVNMTKARIQTHMRNHSSYITEAKNAIQKAAEDHALSTIDKLEEFVDADELIQDIITIGGRKIQTGDMPVDSKLLVAALKEQGARKKSGTLRDLLGELDKQRFIPLVTGEIIEEVTS